ncbi:transient receptor potential cation channel subfamily A member 1-like, partial [Paramuricea clavata]
MCIDNKADINKKSVNGDSPLHMSCCTGNTNAGRVLLENGANINITDNQGFTIIHRAAAKGSVECCAVLLKMGADIDTFHYCGTALVLASRYEQHQVVKYLLDNGATPTIRDKMLDTCLHHAVKNGDVETVKIIMEKCGDQLLELKDKHENTTLHVAARTGNEE